MARSAFGPVAFVRSVGSVGAYRNDLCREKDLENP